ncbi:hypothetical protein AVEN_188813-1 [Araneus ventricosus]|uniref:Phosphomevalonate kinase n=1 Tax=Araneus ventricosus TaxID=182803 RepID=A0A4Y2BSN0_ARAVE|nr:hypothetical protein AVEN_188813-1 [Araneus ventricosus]
MIKWSEAIRNQDPGYFCRHAIQQSQAASKRIWIVSDARRKTDIEFFKTNYPDEIYTIRINASEAVRQKRGWVHTKGKVTSVRYCLISQNVQVVENWRSASRTEIRTADLAAMEITVYHQDDNHEVKRPTDWPVQNLNLKKRNLIDFWVAVKEKFQELGVKAIKYSIPFPNTELVERAFSSNTYIKNKYRNKLEAAPDMRL